ncbi:hypothetical protein B5M09_005378 [Aphanomyces astaci]|uniref:Uncharacterized protein n=1 Tax=Aphanomyces astaci TaxID=112090 RepID=A0A425C4D5_APHAT|nr:hypothetical protein B5M09_005378 [Aphanomyces astaci]
MLQLTALRIFTKLVEFALALPPDYPNRSELVTNVCTRGDPVSQLTLAIRLSNVELQFASLKALYTLACGHPDTNELIQSLHVSNATHTILSYLLHDDSRLSLLASKYIEHNTRYVLTSALNVDGGNEAATGDIICQGLELTALTLTRLLVTATNSDESADLRLQVASQLATALSSPLLKGKIRASSALVLLSSLGRLLERHEDCRTRVKELSFLPNLVHYLMLDETSSAPAGDASDQQEPVDTKAKPGKGGKPVKDSPKKDKETAPPAVTLAAAIPGLDSDAAIVDVQAVVKAEAAKTTLLNVRNAAEKMLHVCATVDGGVDGRVFGKVAIYEGFHVVFSAPDPTTVLRGGWPFDTFRLWIDGSFLDVVRFAAMVLRHNENGLRMGVAGTTSLLTILAEQAKTLDRIDDDPTKRTALVADIAQCLVYLAATSVDVCELCGDDALSPVNAFASFVLQHAGDDAVEVLSPLNYTWGVADSSIVDLTVPPRTIKPQVLCAQALAAFARGVLEFANVPSKAEEAQDKGKAPPLAKEKKQKDASLLPGEKVATRVAAFSLQLLQLLATLHDFDLHVEVLNILQSMPYLPNGRKALLRQAQEQLVLEREPPPSDVAGAVDALRINPPDGLTAGAAPFAQPWTEPLQAYARILEPVLHVFHRSDSPIPDIFAALKVLQGLLVDEKCPQDEYDLDLFTNVAVGQGGLVVLASLLDLPRLHDVPSCPDHDQALVQLLENLLHHLIQWGTHAQGSVLAKLEAYIAEEEDSSDDAKQAIARTKTIASRWTSMLAASHDYARFSLVGVSALLVAVELCHHNLTKLLLQAGVRAEVADQGNNSALMKALAAGHYGIVDDLLAGGANVNTLNNRDQSVLKFCLVSAPQLQSPAIETAMNTLRQAESCMPTGAITSPQCLQVSALEASIVLDSIVVTNAAAPAAYLQVFLEKGSDPNISDDDGSFPLHWVLSSARIRTQIRGCRVCLRFESTQVDAAAVLHLTALLLAHHAHVNVCNKRGQTPLHVAILNGHGEAALLLLQHGAHPFMTDGYTLGCLPLHYLCAGACGPDTIQVLDTILTLSTKFEVTPASFVDLRKGKSEAEKTLVELDAILDDGLEALVAPRALTTSPSSKSDLLIHSSKSGLFPFHYACGVREPELDMTFESNSHTTTTRAEVLKHLVTKYGLNVAQPTTSHHLNALHFAAKYDVAGSNGPVIGFLVESQVPLNAVHEPKDIDVPQMLKPQTTVGYIEDSDPPPIQAYISSYCNLQGYHLVTTTGRHVSLVPRTALVPSQEPLVLVGEFAMSPLHYAVQHSDNATWQLLHAGADLAPDGSDIPLLALACAAQRSVDVIEYLAPRLAPRQANVRVELAPSVHGTALHFAVTNNDVAVAKLLLDADAAALKIKRSRDGYTPLHVACALGLKDMVVFLASKGALAAVTPNNESPLQLLLETQRLDIVEALVDAKFAAEPQLVWIREHYDAQNSAVPEWLRSYVPQSTHQANDTTATDLGKNATINEPNQEQDEPNNAKALESAVFNDDDSLVVQPEFAIH